jgi:hypothetical protein
MHDFIRMQHSKGTTHCSHLQDVEILGRCCCWHKFAKEETYM